MRNRDYIRVAHLQDDILWNLSLPRINKSLDPLALLFMEGGLRPDAILCRVKETGILVAWRSGVVSNLDQRKAAAALSWLEDNPAMTEDAKAEIATALKAWRTKADMTQARAAEVLGIPKRSYEGIEAGRGFVYPQLLMLALLAFER